MILVVSDWIIPIATENVREIYPRVSRAERGEARKEGSGAGAEKGEPEVVGLLNAWRRG